MQVDDVTLWLVEVPQKSPIAPYRSHVRTSSTTTKIIARLRTSDDITGWGEANFNFVPGLDRDAMARDASDFIVGRDPLDIMGFHAACPLENRLKSGLELALWDIAGKAAGKTVAELLGPIVRREIELAACMGIQSYERAGEIAAMYVESGYSTLKTKAGSDPDEDFEMARGVRDAVGDRLKLRIDPNRAYSPEQAAELARRLEQFELEYFEQPIPAEPLSTAAWLRQQTTIPIALNESVIGPDSVMAIFKANAASHILPDTHIAGGLWPCFQIGQCCEEAGIPCIMHCGHDLGMKTAAMLHVAAASPSYSLANDCTYYGLVDDIIKEPFVIKNGRLALPTVPGLGVEGDLEKLRQYSIG